MHVSFGDFDLHGFVVPLVENRRLGFFFGLEHAGFSCIFRHELAIGRGGVVGVTKTENIGRASFHACRFHICIQPVRTEITFIGNVVIVIANGAIGARGLAGTQSITLVGNHAHDAVCTTNNCITGAGLEARRVFALHTQRRQEAPSDFGELALVVVIHLGTKATQWYVVFNLAGHGAGVATNTTLHVERHFPERRFPGGRIN